MIILTYERPLTSTNWKFASPPSIGGTSYIQVTAHEFMLTFTLKPNTCVHRYCVLNPGHVE